MNNRVLRSLTIPALFERQAEGAPDGPLYYERDGERSWKPITRRQALEAFARAETALHSLGLAAGDRFGIFLPTSFFWETMHAAALFRGAVAVGLDMHEQPERLKIITETASLAGLVVEKSSQLAGFDPACLARCRFILVVHQDSPSLPANAHLWREPSATSGAPPRPALTPDMPAALIFTSGTTGRPKGLLYTHGQMMEACVAIATAYPTFDEMRFLCWLPLSNLFQRMTNLVAMAKGGAIYLLPDPRQVMEAVRQTEPDIFVAVPRFYQKLHAGIEAKIRGLFFPIRFMVRLAQLLGNARAKRTRDGRAVPAALAAAHGLISGIFLAPVRRIMGRRLRFLLSGSAPMPGWLLEYFHALGWPVLEAYGLSENTVPLALNRPDSFRFGSVGQPLYPNLVKVDALGSVWVKGPGLFTGYLGDPAPERVDGYHETGDLGRVDEGGFLYLTGRKSDLIKTSTGRRVAPSGVEAALLKNGTVLQAVVIGNNRPQLTALVTLDFEKLGVAPPAEGQDLPAPLRQAIEGSLSATFAALSPHERPAGVIVFRQPFTAQNQEVTANLKLRRAAIEKRFMPWIERLYALMAANPANACQFLFVSSVELREAAMAKSGTMAGVSSAPWRRIATLAKVYWAFLKSRRWGPAASAHHGGAWRRRRQVEAVNDLAELIAREIGAMKGPVVKVFQMLSYIGAEKLPETMRQALESLQAASPALPAEIVRPLIERELGKPISALFAEFHDRPLAAASIGQVHWARLHDGRAVIVKVRYPNIDGVISADLRMLRMLLPPMARILNVDNFAEIISELRDLMLAECNFLKEARNQKIFRRMFADFPDLLIPETVDSHSTAQVLTMEYVEGLTFEEFKRTSNQAQKNRAAETIWRMSAVSINRYAFFNADPHPGNYLFLPDGRVAFIDFGFVKQWTTGFIDQWKEQTLAGCALDLEWFTRATKALGFPAGEGFDYRAMMEVCHHVFYQPYIEDRLYRFTPEWVREELRLMFADSPNAGHARAPVDFVALARLYAGQHAVLADLMAEANWHKHVFPLFKEPTGNIDQLL